MKRRNSILLAICAVILLLAGTATGVYAKYVRQAGNVENTFAPAVSIIPEIKSGMSDIDIAVGPTDYPVYVRAAIIVTWQDNDGIVHFTKPAAGTDYTLALNLTNWEQGGDGYYYCKEPVKSTQETPGKTPVLINSCTQTGTPPAEGYALNLEVIAQTVQAVGYTDGDGVDPATEIDAYKDAWGVSLDNG